MGVKAFFVGLIMTVIGALSFLVTWGILNYDFPFLIQIVFDSMTPLWSLVMTVVGVLVMLFGSRTSSKNIR